MRKLNLDELKKRQESRARSPMPVALMLDRIRSIHNVGAFFRTGDGAGIEKIFITGWTAFPPRPEITKVALGAEEAVPWERYKDPVEAVQAAKEQGYQLIAVEQTDCSTDLFTTELPFPCCLVFGNEVDGVQDAIVEWCDLAVEVPMHGTKESLNVSVCAGAVLFEVRRQYEARVIQAGKW